MSFRLACSCWKGRASVMSSGTADTIRCHPWCFFFFCLSVPDSFEKESGIKSQGACIGTFTVSYWRSSGAGRHQWNLCSFAAASERIDPNLPEWVISSHHVFTLPWLPATAVRQDQSTETPSWCVLYGSLSHAPTWSRHLWTFIWGGPLVQLSVGYISVYICAAWGLLLVQSKCLPREAIKTRSRSTYLSKSAHCANISQTHAWILDRPPCLFWRTKEVKRTSK